MKKILAAATLAGAAIVTAACGSAPTVGVTAPSPSTTPPTMPATTPAASTPVPVTTPMITPAKAPSKTPSPSAPMGTPECTTSDLAASLNMGNGAAGTIYYELKFTDTSSSKCFMMGHPGVIAANISGNLGASAVREAGTANRITLAPGSSAEAQLAYHDAKTTTPGCDIVMATELKVIAPDQRDSLIIPFSNQVCASASVALFYIWPLT